MAKTFKTAPKPSKQPTAEEITAFEQGGAGHDDQPTITPVPPPTRPSEPTKRLSLDLPESLHRRFKTACSATSRKMAKELLDYIERRTSELEEEAATHK